MPAPRMRVGVYGDSRMSSLPELLSSVGHDVSYMDYGPVPPAFEELDLVVLEVRSTLLESAIEKLAEKARRGQIFIHTSVAHGVQIMDPLEVTGALVIALGELSRERWVGTCLDELGETVANLLVGEFGASVFHVTDEERVRIAAALTYIGATKSLYGDAMRLLADVLGDVQEADDIAEQVPRTIRLPDIAGAAGLRAQWESVADPGQARAFRQATRRVAELQRNQDVELWAIQEEKL